MPDQWPPLSKPPGDSEISRPQRFKLAIYRSAVKLFGERGLSETGIRDIARDAGVSEAALYRHWAGKEELAREIFLQGMAGLHEQLHQRVPLTGHPGDAIRAVVHTYFETYDENPHVVQYVLLNQHVVWRPADREAPNPVSFWFDWLRIHRAEFNLPDMQHAEVLGPMTLGMILRPAIAVAYGSLAPPLAQYTGTVSAAICRALGVDPLSTSPPLPLNHAAS